MMNMESKICFHCKMRRLKLPFCKASPQALKKCVYMCVCEYVVYAHVFVCVCVCVCVCVYACVGHSKHSASIRSTKYSSLYLSMRTMVLEVLFHMLMANIAAPHMCVCLYI